MKNKCDSFKAIEIRESGDLVSSIEEKYSRLDYEYFQNFRSEHTIKSYRNDIQKFWEFMSDNFQEILNVNSLERVHLVAYRNWQQDNDFAPKTINRKLSSLSSYFDFLIEKNIMESNPVLNVRRPRQEVVKETNDLTDQQIKALFDVLNTKTHAIYLHRAVIYVLFSTGIRKSELIYLKRKNYIEINGHKVIEIVAKGGKHLTKVIHPICAEIIDNYLDWMENQGRGHESEDWLFQPTKNPSTPSELNRPLGPKSVDYIVKTYAKKAGITENISPHSARASYIGSALEAGGDLLKVSIDVGHSSVRTTQEYNKRRQKISESPAYDLGYFKKTS
jgi:integrase/recombinase XerD